MYLRDMRENKLYRFNKIIPFKSSRNNTLIQFEIQQELYLNNNITRSIV